MTPMNRALKKFLTTAVASLLIAVSPINQSFANEVNIEQRASNTDQIELEWPSQTGKAYRIYQSESLGSAFTVEAEKMQATPPKNIWWTNRDAFERRFFKIQTHGEAQLLQSVINTNYDFSEEQMIG